MSGVLRFTADASAELEDAARWYEQRHAGLGMAFLAAVDDAVGTILRWPGAGAPVDGVDDDLDVRRQRVRRFPYHLAYLVAADDIYVLAVAHDHRRPGYWRTRLGRK